MDTVTNKVREYPGTCAVLVAVLAVVCIILLIVMLTKKKDKFAAGVLRYGNFGGNMNPLWQLGSEDAGRYGSMDHEVRETGMFDARAQYDRSGGILPVDQSYHLHDTFTEGMTPGCGTTDPVRAEAAALGLLGAINTTEHTKAARMARGYHDSDLAMPYGALRAVQEGTNGNPPLGLF